MGKVLESDESFAGVAGRLAGVVGSPAETLKRDTGTRLCHELLFTTIIRATVASIALFVGVAGDHERIVSCESLADI